MHIGTVAALWRYPIKSLAGEALERTQIDAAGLPGDRAGALLVANPDHARAGKPLRGKEHHLLHTLTDAAAAIALAQRDGIALEFEAAEHFFDARPLSLLFDTWLHDVEALVGRALDPRRYRANIFAHAALGFDRREPDMLGATLGIGSVVLQVVAPIGRCVTTTYDIGSGESDPEVLRAVAQHRDNKVGIYCTIVQRGEIERGERLVLL